MKVARARVISHPSFADSNCQQGLLSCRYYSLEKNAMVKTATQKLQTPATPKIVKTLPVRVEHWGPPGASMVISTPLEMEEFVRQIPKGKLVTLEGLRDVAAKRHKTTITCPVTTGIFLGMVARAAAEQEMLGMKRVAPWWRVLRSDGTLNEKYPGGIAEHQKRLEAEGHKTAPRGKAKREVVEYEKKVAKLHA
jgi:alkylated DNA nucleotide flippase Atl1